MKIALYNDRSDLPYFSENVMDPVQPEEMFSPKHVGARKLLFDGKKIPVRGSWAWPILMGLHAIKLPVMAHVSIFIRANGSKRISNGFLNVQITPISGGKNILLREIGCRFRLVKNGEEVVGTTSLWKKYFLKELLSLKEEARKEAAEAADRAITTWERYKLLSRSIPD